MELNLHVPAAAAASQMRLLASGGNNNLTIHKNPAFSSAISTSATTRAPHRILYAIAGHSLEHKPVLS